MITLSICMIVKNEEKVLDRCLKSLEGLYDELIIVDTGSTDSTKDIALRYTDKVFDFEWVDDFSAARNFSFEKASMDYIYVADADEYIDSNNKNKFSDLLNILMTEIEIVQMVYINEHDFNTTENFKRDLRPKLYKRTRTFSWIDPVHESVRLSPIVFDSDIEIIHMPDSVHSKRDFEIFQKIFSKSKISKKLLNMYARELLISGSDFDFFNAKEIFESVLNDPERSSTEILDSSCVLSKIYRLENRNEDFLSLCLNVISTSPCSEICIELGEYYLSLHKNNEASQWFFNAKNSCEPVLNINAQTIQADDGLLRCGMI